VVVPPSGIFIIKVVIKENIENDQTSYASNMVVKVLKHYEAKLLFF
jgi:hypothetical protein